MAAMAATAATVAEMAAMAVTAAVMAAAEQMEAPAVTADRVVVRAWSAVAESLAMVAVGNCAGHNHHNQNQGCKRHTQHLDRHHRRCRRKDSSSCVCRRTQWSSERALKR